MKEKGKKKLNEAEAFKHVSNVMDILKRELNGEDISEEEIEQVRKRFYELVNYER